MSSPAPAAPGGTPPTRGQTWAPSRLPVTPRAGTGFTVVVAIAVLLGALVMAVVLLLSSAPGAIVLGVVLAALPVGPVLACFRWLDRYEPEPRNLMLMAIGWGAFVATSSALILQLVGEFALQAPESFGGAVVAPVTEEAAKGLFLVLLLIFRRAEFDGVLDGIVYAGGIGVGFAFTENILYLSSAYVGTDGEPGGTGATVATFVLRGIFSPFAHPLFTTFTGIGVGIAVSTRRRWLRVLAPVGGYLLAVAAHATWNGSVFLGGGQAFVLVYVLVMVPVFLALVGFAIAIRRREGQILATALGDCSRRGFLPAAEIPWLVRLPARRLARRNAKAIGGAAALATMKAYQTAAVELGILHHRYLQGTPPRDFAARGQAYVGQLAALRPSLVWPSVAGTKTPPPTAPPPAPAPVAAPRGGP